MAKHTPGPWKYDTDLQPLGCVETKSLKRICDIQYPHKASTMSSDKFEKQARANGHLIAAAPEMYEALQDALCHLHHKDAKGLAAMRAIIKAIGKAKGEP